MVWMTDDSSSSTRYLKEPRIILSSRVPLMGFSTLAIWSCSVMEVMVLPVASVLALATTACSIWETLVPAAVSLAAVTEYFLILNVSSLGKVCSPSEALSSVTFGTTPEPPLRFCGHA